MRVNLNCSKEEVIQFLKQNGFQANLTKKFNEEEIDGEAFSLLTSDDYQALSIRISKDKKKMNQLIENNGESLIKIKDKMKEDEIYKQLYEENLEDIWDSLEDKLSELKLGEKLKYIKYLLIRDPPPTRTHEYLIIPYLKKVFPELEESDIKKMKENYEMLNDQNIFSLLDSIGKLKLNIIIELIKLKIAQEEEEEEKTIELKDIFKIYSVIEIYENTTSQGLHSKSLLNRLEEFKLICEGFNIECDNNCNEIKYDQALKTKLASFLLWGSKNGLIKFLAENKINSINKYFTEKEKKTGIYLCVNETDKIAFLVIWPGECTYKHSNSEEPKSNLLLTLLRYGLSFSHYSILCLSDEEINNFDFDGYKILEQITINEGTGVQRSRFETNINERMTFLIRNEKELSRGINQNFQNIKIINFKFRQNYILFYKENISENNNETEVQKTEICLCEISQITETTDLSILKINDNIKTGGNTEVYDYYPHETERLEINKNNITNKIKITFGSHNIPEFNGSYDYDSISDTLIIYDENTKEINIYFKNNNKNSLPNDKKLDKIILIPKAQNGGIQNGMNQNDNEHNILLFYDNKICVVNSNDNTNIINLLDEFQYEKFSELQFIVYVDFILILKYEENNKWIGKIYSLNMKDNSLFKKIADIKLESEEASVFSFYEINYTKYLISLTINENKPKIKYWEIISRLSGFSTDWRTENSNIIQNQNISLGNCVVDYFFHCFSKYSLIGSIEYARGYNCSIKLSIFVGSEQKNKLPEFNKYINELIKICEKVKNISFKDVNFGIINNYKKLYKIINTSLGEILIKILEATPIQIAKILGNRFEIVDGKGGIMNLDNINNEENGENVNTYTILKNSEKINFGIKESILTFFDLPVVVICCFGSQSVGKSTFLNEITGSIFNVSGMRCTEGIWMSVKIFNSSIEENDNSVSLCTNNCEICNIKQCCLFNEHETKCVCNDCKCGKNCELKGNSNSNCTKECILEKNHEKLIECSVPLCNCKCKCLINCICKNHNHFCKRCSEKEEQRCYCKCNCRHICKIPFLKHDFICVSLDFEGLGTYERRDEQDIQMALVGSAIGNYTIFRMGNSLDKLLGNFLQKLSDAGRNVKDLNINTYFGGVLCLSPKDVIDGDRAGIIKTIDDKLYEFVRKWNFDNCNGNQIEPENNKNKYFGLFESSIVIPTTLYNTTQFFKYLREELNKYLIEDTLKYHQSPIYQTGKEFSKNLKVFLYAVKTRGYDFLVSYKMKLFDRYVENNVKQAYEICGSLKENEILNDQIINTIGDANIYINNIFMNHLEIDPVNKRKYNINNKLKINNINITSQIEERNFHIEQYNIQVIISENNEWIEIKNLNDFGLILKKPEKIQKKIDIREEIVKIWKSISHRIGLNEKESTRIFSSFINAIIKRRNNNVSNWILETKNNCIELRQNNYQGANLEIMWTVCEDKCYYCFNKCCLLISNHSSEHKCFYDHKCKNKCFICSTNTCKDEHCNQMCSLPYGHPESDIHNCKHFHPCYGVCYLKEKSTDCLSDCILEYGHENNNNEKQHFCGKERHQCNGICDLNEVARNCQNQGKCILPSPHPNENHKCNEKNEHLCKEECYLKENEGCENICKEPYGHDPNKRHRCAGKHKCNFKCDKFNQQQRCTRTCTLEYPHPDGNPQHDCKESHICTKHCDYENYSINCKNYCCLPDNDNHRYHLCEKKFEHLCNKPCNLRDLANNCGGTCVKTLPDSNYSIHLIHSCSNQHKCKNPCPLKNDSQYCNNYCAKNFQHPPLPCKCDVEKHICNKQCRISISCNRLCILETGHSGNCLCGNCNCTHSCKYKNLSLRGCNKVCKFKEGENNHKEHICDGNHLCNIDCKYKSFSNDCDNNGKCGLPYSHDGPHVCNETKLHKCKEKCNKPGRICYNDCTIVVHSNGSLVHTTNDEHKCSNTHLCDEPCYFKEMSINCNQKCCEVYGHRGRHKCDLNNHVCRGICSLKDNTREGYCNTKCFLTAEHQGNCICSRSKEEHICKYRCSLPKCQSLCILNALQHESNQQHICELPKRSHKCPKKCLLYIKRNNVKEICNQDCADSLEHEQEGRRTCKCQCATHLCNKPCDYKSKSRINTCSGNCEELYENEHTTHKCNMVHLCKDECYYYKIFKSDNTGRCDHCNKKCCLSYPHPGNCICESPHEHPCYKDCSYRSGGGCNIKCKLEYGHETSKPHDCKGYHICQENCYFKNPYGSWERDSNLCQEPCGHVYNHNNDNNLKCQKCSNKTCILGNGKGHLCGGEHKCHELCQSPGICDIDKNESGDGVKKIYNGIEYLEINPQKEKLKKACKIGIPPNKIIHENNHWCGKTEHTCTFQCKQCLYYCTKEYDHEKKGELHFCTHGNIKQSFVYISDKNEQSAQIIKDKKSHQFKDGEKAIIFYCDKYCRDQGQGHIHYFDSLEPPEKIVDDINVRKVEKKDYIYECKCDYFWKHVLKFKSVVIRDDDYKKFNKCPWKCKYRSHIEPEYCQLPLWHKQKSGISLGTKWNKDGHIFKCQHPIGIYNIFLVDYSYSMSSKASRPTSKYGIGKTLDNMLGAAIEAIVEYCSIREIESPKDKCAIIGFDDKVTEVFKNKDIDDKEILKECLKRLKLGNCTEFKGAFEKAFNLIESSTFDRNQLVPLIILLTDGEDSKFEETCKYLKEVSTNKYII